MAIIKKFRIKSYKKQNVLLKLDKLSFKFGNRVILEDLDLSLEKNQILGLLGPNGAGKSTIFNLIIGLIKPNFGSIRIDDNIINHLPVFERTAKFKIGFVPQYGGFFHDLTVIENLNGIGEIVLNNKNYKEEKVNSLISRFELGNIKNIKANNLSGGQKKRLVIALALLSEPKILLLDEPFAALDILTIKSLQKIIVDMQYKENVSIILCDHQARDLLACVDSAAIINDGKVIAQDTPSNLINNINAKKFYFGESFRIN